MSAEVLREAAASIRERAEAAEWTLADPAWYVAEDFTCTRPAEAEHIASWHPAVALAVADWLDSEDTHQFGPTEHAINVARAYLGRAS